MDEAIRRVLSHGSDRLIAIDGLPCAGKSTLVDRLEALAGAQCIYLDDFVLPRGDWRSEAAGFPFGYIRYDEFAQAIAEVAANGSTRYRPFDWATGKVGAEFKEITRSAQVIVEGVSALNPEFCTHYDEKVFVESDPATLPSALAERGYGPWEEEWQTIFLPSVEIYMQTRPRDRAELLVAGRGIGAHPS
ncbi:hypothetical protein GCM10010862_16470 [Devosia nitrariae]|uniref:Uridine kinase n=2 Tax=Devosia nitrariae TaxID=2071872 RepID=A0ABQ5W2X4_9HYPH|nr:hypothetical protein GCM10010862_16470 [Devosia nitrariae]